MTRFDPNRGSITEPLLYKDLLRTVLEIRGALSFNQRIRKLRLEVRWNSNFPVRSEIVDYPQRYSSFPVRNRMTEISFPVGFIFQFPVSQQPKAICTSRLVSLLFWKLKTLTIIQQSSQPVYFDK